jgi:hypothetical protein
MSKNLSYESALVGNWTGGLNYDVLAAAEELSYGWHYYFKVKNLSLFC